MTTVKNEALSVDEKIFPLLAKFVGQSDEHQKAFEDFASFCESYNGIALGRVAPRLEAVLKIKGDGNSAELLSDGVWVHHRVCTWTDPVVVLGMYTQMPVRNIKALLKIRSSRVAGSGREGQDKVTFWW